MKKNINFAIVGFGGIGKTHAIAAYSSNFKLNLPFYLNLKAVNTRRDLDYIMPGVSEVKDITCLLDDKDIDFIDICTPNKLHREAVEKAVLKGKPIYCEKPLASNVEDARVLTELVEKAAIKNVVALMYRFMPAVRLAKKEIERGTIGEIIDFKGTLFHKSYLDPNKKTGWRTTEESGGGALLDLGVHVIDMIHFVLGNTLAVKCSSNIYFKERTSVDETAFVSLTLRTGCYGSIEVSRIHAEPEEKTSLKIYGTKGSLELSTSNPYALSIYSFEKNTLEIIKPDKHSDIMRFYPDERSSMGYHTDCHMASLANFASILYEGERKEDNITPSFKDSLLAEKVVKSCYESSIENREIIV
jgi:predicted dehydrogenase